MVHCALGGENRRVPRPGRLMKGKLLENSGITSSDLLQVFHLNRYWECWGHQRKRMKDRHTSYENCIKSIQFGPLASTQRTKLEANICGRGSDWWALSASPPRGCIKHKVAKHLMMVGDSADGVYVYQWYLQNLSYDSFTNCMVYYVHLVLMMHGYFKILVIVYCFCHLLNSD